MLNSFPNFAFLVAINLVQAGGGGNMLTASELQSNCESKYFIKHGKCQK